MVKKVKAAAEEKVMAIPDPVEGEGGGGIVLPPVVDTPVTPTPIVEDKSWQKWVLAGLVVVIAVIIFL